MLKIWIRYPHLLSTRIHIGVAITKMSLCHTVTLQISHPKVKSTFLLFWGRLSCLSVWLLPRRNSWLNFRMHPRERCWEARTTHYFPPLGVAGGGFAGVRERKKEGVASARAQASFVKLWTPLRATLIKKRAFLIYTLTYYTLLLRLVKGNRPSNRGR